MDKEDVVYIHNGILLGNEKNEIWPFVATWMELESVMRNESYRERQIPYVFTHIWILKNPTEDQGRGEGGKKVTEREGGKP